MYINCEKLSVADNFHVLQFFIRYIFFFDGKSILKRKLNEKSLKTKKAISLIYCTSRLLSCLNPHHYVILNEKERKTEKEIRLFCLPFFHLLCMYSNCIYSIICRMYVKIVDYFMIVYTFELKKKNW